MNPTGGKDAFKDFEKTDFVLIINMLSNYKQLNTIKSLDLKKVKIIAPETVSKIFPKIIRSRTITMTSVLKKILKTLL